MWGLFWAVDVWDLRAVLYIHRIANKNRLPRVLCCIFFRNPPSRRVGPPTLSACEAPDSGFALDVRPSRRVGPLSPFLPLFFVLVCASALVVLPASCLEGPADPPTPHLEPGVPTALEGPRIRWYWRKVGSTRRVSPRPRRYHHCSLGRHAAYT